MDPLESLSGQIPQPSTKEAKSQGMPLEACVLLTRDFNVAMGLPKGELPCCVDKARGAVYGRMLREEVQEVEEAIASGVLHEVLAESIDILYLTFNMLQECGLERAFEPAFLMKHEDNMKKQHETVAHLAWTRNVCLQSTDKTEAEMAFTVSSTEGGKWLLYSQGKLVKPYDYVPGDYEALVKLLADENSVEGQDHVPKAHSSGPHTSQYTFASVGVQVAATSIDSSRQASNGTLHHGWQPALMTSFMWLANVTGEWYGWEDRGSQNEKWEWKNDEKWEWKNDEWKNDDWYSYGWQSGWHSGYVFRAPRSWE